MVKPLSLLAALAATLAIATVGRGGHELPMYPSYYPHEIAIETIPPERAAPLLLENKIQAYLGPQPRFSGDVPVSIRAVESLGSFVIVLRNPAAPAPTDAARCTVLDFGVRWRAADISLPCAAENTRDGVLGCANDAGVHPVAVGVVPDRFHRDNGGYGRTQDACHTKTLE